MAACNAQLSNRAIVHVFSTEMRTDPRHGPVNVGRSGSKKAVDLVILCNTSNRNITRSWRASKRTGPTTVDSQC